MKKKNINVWILRFLFCVSVILIYQIVVNFNVILEVFKKICNILKPFIIGAIIAFLFFPICRKVENLFIKTEKEFFVKRARTFATLIVVFCIVFFVCYLIFKLVPILYEALLKFTEDISSNFSNKYEELENRVKDVEVLNLILKELKNQLSFDNLTKMLVSLNYKAYFEGIANLIFKIFNLFIGIMISIYILLDRYYIKKAVLRFFNVTLKKEKSNRIFRALNKIKTIIYTFIFGQIIDAFIVGCSLGIVFSLLKIKNSLIFAVIYFVFAMIPYFGSIIAVILISLFSYVVGNFNEFLTCSITSIVLQQVDSNLINPKIVGQIVGVKPLYVILGITLFGGVFGFVGLFFGPPLMAVCLEVLDDFIKEKESKNLDEVLDFKDGNININSRKLKNER